MNTKHSDRFVKFFSLTRIFAQLLGVDMVSDEYRMTWNTWGVLFLINSSILFTFYTVYVVITVEQDWIDAIKCLCMFCTGIQGYAKLINGLKRKHVVCFLYKETVSIYTNYEKKSKNYHQLLSDSFKLVNKLIQILLAIILLTCLAIIGVPVFYLLVLKQRIFVMPFYLPFVNYETDFGFYFNSLFHAICVICGVTGNFINDSWCFIFAAHIPLIKNILLAKFKELDELLLADDDKFDIKIKELLTDVLQWHQHYILYSDTVKTFFFWVIFVQVSMEFVSIVSTVVCLFLGVWPAAPVFLVYSFALFYFHCALGNIVELANDDVTLMIYDSYWYKLSVPQQKMLLIMLRSSQQAEGMSIGGIAPLSMHTALQLTKTIYTFSMMLRNFLD